MEPVDRTLSKTIMAEPSCSRNIIIIGNPVAGSGSTVRKARYLENLLRSRSHRVEVFLTNRPGDATSRARDIDSSYDRIVVAGGDGTVNEVLNGLREPFSVPLVHFGTGTANQLANHLKIPKKTSDLVPLIENGTTQMVDIGVVGDHRFLLQTSSGFDAIVTKVLAEEPKVCSGYLAYLMPILRAIYRHNRLTDLDVQIDGRAPIKSRGVIITKVSHYGGLFVFCPNASMQTGAFDICLFQERKLWTHLCSFLAALLRLTPYVPWISHARGTRVSVDAPFPTPVQIDGTYVGTTPIEVRLIPRCLPVIVGKSFRGADGNS